MRTITEAYNHIKEQDENTALTLFALRNLVKTGALPSVSVGRKRLINLEVLEQYLKGNIQHQQEDEDKMVHYVEIRKIEG